MGLKEYNKKRDFTATSEPRGIADKNHKNRFVIQRHQARRLHYDFRLELNGVLKSWAVPKGPSLNSADKRFAVMTEDHPVKYLDFKGQIPEGHYGAGLMEIWDTGYYFAVDQDMNTLTPAQATRALNKGELKIFLKGENIEGGYVLIRLKDSEKNWLLIKHNDEFNQHKKYDAEKVRPISRKTSKSTGEPRAARKTAVKKTAKKKTTPAGKKAGKKTTPVKKNAAKKSRSKGTG